MTWQKVLAQGFDTARKLLQFLELPVVLGCENAEKIFSTRVPLSFAQRMQPRHPKDPLLLQVLATSDEMHAVTGYTWDPLHEINVNPLPGLIHKYHGRVLLTLTGGCAINCRYCFRRHFPYSDNNPGRKGWYDVFDYIRQNEIITEIILSGGDPLLMTDIILNEFLEEILTIKHIKTLRIHTRIPIVLPERINSALLSLLANITHNKVIVLHCNHAQEINSAIQKMCFALHDVGCHLLNQSVLLHQVNDDAVILANLSHKLFACKILPYYLHLLDKVNGAAHFDLHKSRALNIYEQLQVLLPGYLVPRLVYEKSGTANKILIGN